MGKKGLLIILSGPSGVGKGTIRKELFMDESLHLTYSVSMTTRNKRAGETNGVEYYFVSRDEFEKNIAEDKLLEYSEFVNNLYGTPAAEVERLRNEGYNVLLEIEVNGASQVIQKIPEAITIFLIPPNLHELEERIRGRKSESNDIIQLRLQKARNEMKLKNTYKYVIVNSDLKKATQRIASIIKKVERNTL
ncbi:MAG: guanylate kinase [Bacillales bacterium]|jgi:guanylate kinase|nr:guanylate kinase [Bacillales bacterium]